MADTDKSCVMFFFFQAEDGIRDVAVTGVQTCALPISLSLGLRPARPAPRRAPAPPRRQSRYHRLTLWRLTLSSRAMAAKISLPAANKRPARLRRCSIPPKSRRGEKGVCIRSEEHTSEL